jgi:hypothetical protein
MVVPFKRTTAKLNAVFSLSPWRPWRAGPRTKVENALQKARNHFDLLGQALTENRL